MLAKRRMAFSNLSYRTGRVFSKICSSPNKWTLFTFVPTIVTMYFILNQEFIFAAISFIVASFLDFVDGSVARVTGRSTNLGAYMDTIVDRYIEFLVIVPLLFAGLPGFYLPFAFWLLLYLFGSMMTTYAKASAKETGLVPEGLRGGLLERAERLIILTAGFFLAGFLGTIYLTMVIAALAVLSNLTAIQRVGIAARKARYLSF